MLNNNLLKYSSSPHIKAPHGTKWIMLNVCIALLPACIMGVIYFGLYALLLLALSVLSAVLAEVIFLLCIGKKFNEIIKSFDFTSCVTGLLMGMTLGTNYPWYSPIFGSFFAIIVVKMLFGGTGKNLVNPAIAGRIFIFISFQSVVAEWVTPTLFTTGEITTGATALVNLLENGLLSISNFNLFFGIGVAGCIGETCKIALLVGAIYLAILKIIDIRYPLIYVAVTGLFTVCLNGFNFEYFLPSILSGGLIIGAFFMATDYVTTPNTKLGNYIYFILLGLITAGLRQATKMEVISFAIMLMNLVIPLLDKFIIPKPFGYKKQREVK
ncbi:MAG: RnfABCDGE type electron transport complex subunit D [Clostridia bacterium]|nr:RnfABCDGE type electron transport complex subunit D [Clostridia bacterium]